MSPHTTLHPRSPTTSAAAETTRGPSRRDDDLRRLTQSVEELAADERSVDSLLTQLLARRRAVRQALREQAAAQARRENEQAMQRALLGTGLSHLR